MNRNRAGLYLPQPSGYRAFIPTDLPPDPPLRLDGEMQVLLSEADRAIGRLDAATELLPNPELFVAMYVRKEAVYSSQIEGTQASLTDLLEYEAEAAKVGTQGDVRELVNYVDAMSYGLVRLRELPLSVRLIREIHGRLMDGLRGGERERGEIRRSQNWIGAPGCTLSEASFVPPPPDEAARALGRLEHFMHSDQPIPILIKAGLAHAQFETIHPFIDGNGRVGRLLITFLLCWKGVLQRPLLYLSDYLKRNRNEYYERLQHVRDEGDWEGWIRFFLEGVRSVAREATATARSIQELRDRHRAIIGEQISGTPTGLVLLDALFQQPMMSVNMVADRIGRSYPAASDLVRTFERLDLLEEITGAKRNRVYAYRPYLTLFG